MHWRSSLVFRNLPSLSHMRYSCQREARRHEPLPSYSRRTRDMRSHDGARATKFMRCAPADEVNLDNQSVAARRCTLSRCVCVCDGRGPASARDRLDSFVFACTARVKPPPPSPDDRMQASLRRQSGACYEPMHGADDAAEFRSVAPRRRRRLAASAATRLLAAARRLRSTVSPTFDCLLLPRQATFNSSELLKSDIDAVAEVDPREVSRSARLLMEKSHRESAPTEEQWRRHAASGARAFTRYKRRFPESSGTPGSMR